MLEGIEAVIFDLDGTLIDSMQVYPLIDKTFFESKGKPVPKNLSKELEGKSFMEACQYFKDEYGIEGTIEQIHDDWIATSTYIFVNVVKLKKGAHDFVHKLHDEKQVKLAIATSNAKEMTKKVTVSHEIDCFDLIKTSSEVEHAKPAPDVYISAAKELGVKPENCLVFEDTVEGILAGKGAGMKVCAIFDEYSKPRDAEKRKLSDYYIQSFDDVFDGTYEKLK